MTSEVTQADSGMDGQSVERAELVWANLPTNRPWASLPTYEKALVCHTLARLTAQSGEGRSGAGGDGPTTAIISGLWLDILEKDDRTSPEESPDMALITEEEFAGSIRYALAALNARQSGEGERATCANNARVGCEGDRLREALAEAADKFAKLADSMREEEADLLAPEIAVCELGREECLAALRAIDDAGGA